MTIFILTSLLLVEGLLVAGAVVLYRRYRRRCGARRAASPQGEQPQQQPEDKQHSDWLHGYLTFELQRMQALLDDMAEGDSERPVLEKRLTVFNNELAILNAMRASGHSAGDKALICKYYGSPDLDRTPEFDKLRLAVSRYQEHIANLEQYRQLFFRSQDDLADEVNRVLDLSRRLTEGKLTEEEQARLIEELEAERSKLAKELNIADHELEAIMSNMGKTVDTSLEAALPTGDEIDLLMEQMRAIEEENEFLQVQIQHLLKLEMDKQDGAPAAAAANVDTGSDPDNEMEQALAAEVARTADLEAKYNELEAKYLDLETRYLQAVG